MCISRCSTGVWQFSGAGSAGAAPHLHRPFACSPRAVALQLLCRRGHTVEELTDMCQRKGGEGTVVGRWKGSGLAKSLIIMIVRINNKGYFCGLKLMEKNYATI